jgi:hypothetical protein
VTSPPTLSVEDVAAAIGVARRSRPYRVTVWARCVMLAAAAVVLGAAAIGIAARDGAVAASGIGLGIGVGFWATFTYAVCFRYTTTLVRAQALGHGTSVVAPLASWEGIRTAHYVRQLRAALHDDAWHRRTGATPTPDAVVGGSAGSTQSSAPVASTTGGTFAVTLQDARATPTYLAAVRRTRRLLCVTIPLALVVPFLLGSGGSYLGVSDVPSTLGLSVLLCVVMALDARTQIGFAPANARLAFVRQFLTDVVHRDPSPPTP